MKILITGGTGKLGRELIRVFPNSIHPTRHEMDITNYETVNNIISREKPEIIIHKAALTGIKQCEENKELAYVLYELYKSVPLKDAKDTCEYCWRVDWQNKILILPNGLRFYLYSVDPLIFSETFIHDIHFVGFDLKDKVIVDVGAFVGDTALYYASLGAVVYAYEPHPINFYWLKKNIELNSRLKDRIILFNEAVGKDEEIKIPIGGNINGGFSIYSPVKEKALRIKSISLRKILEENNLNNPDLLKADCKGCEYYIIEDDAISKFEKVKIEYTGFNRPKVDHIINKLKSKGFSKFRVYKHNWLIYHLSDHGTIYAEK